MITDLTPYQKHLDAFDLTEQEKLELVNAIWVIGKNILDKKYGLNQPNYPQCKTSKSVDLTK